MSVFKCKMCGAQLDIEEGQTIAECDYCGTKQTVPVLDNEKKIQLFSRANRLRFNCEFDKAAGVYENIVSEFPEEAEAYWGIILCKYGIEYVDDPATAKKIPTCHRSSFDSVFDDESFDMVMEYADMMSKSVYREEAKAIEEIRKGIVEISSKEEPYDIFICYKETDENGQRTIDSVIAQDVYDALTEKGYKVFFSRITLEDKLGVEYEPYIFAALNSAKVMLAFGTKYEYYDAVWVKNEWSRFLRIIANDHNKYLIPCFRDIDAYDMPREFARLQSQDMGKVGSIQDLLRGIGKIIRPALAPAVLEKPTVEYRENSQIESLMKRIQMFISDKSWNEAADYCERVLDIDPECGEVYLYKFQTLENIADLNDFHFNNQKDYASDSNIIKAKQFGNNEIKDRVSSIIRRSLRSRYTPLSAVSDGNLEAVKIFIEDGTDANKTYEDPDNGNSEISMLMKAVIRNDRIITEYLISNGADVNFIFKGKYADISVLSYAIIQSKDFEIIKLLVEAGADISIPRKVHTFEHKCECSPLYDAVTVSKNKAVTEYLISKGADVNFIIKDINFDSSVLIEAINETKSIEIVKLLVEAGADISITKKIHDSNGNTELSPLFDAVDVAKSKDIAEYLISKGADVNFTKKGKVVDCSVLSSAIVTAKSLEIVKLLAEAGADVNIPRKRHKSNIDCELSPLYDAVSEAKSKEMTEYLISKGADVNFISNDKDADISVLSCAIAISKNFEIVKLLVEAGADVNIPKKLHNDKNNCEQSPLYDAVLEAKSKEMTEYLICNGADVNFVSHDVDADCSVLSVAIIGAKDFEIVKLLVEAGADVNVPRKLHNENGHFYSPLYDAVMMARSKLIAEYLISKGADANFISNGKDVDISVLSCAIVVAKSFDVVKLLVDAGADVNITRKIHTNESNCEQSPLYDAIAVAESMEIAKYLTEKGADVNFVKIGADYDVSILTQAIIMKVNSFQLVKALVDAGADVNKGRIVHKTDSEFTPLMDSVDKDFRIMDCLLDNGADPNKIVKQSLKYSDGSSYKHGNLNLAAYAVICGKIDHLKKIMKNTDMNQTITYDGKTATFKRFPFTTSQNELRANGWKGPGFFSF